MSVFKVKFLPVNSQFSLAKKLILVLINHSLPGQCIVKPLSLLHKFPNLELTRLEPFLFDFHNMHDHPEHPEDPEDEKKPGGDSNGLAPPVLPIIKLGAKASCAIILHFDIMIKGFLKPIGTILDGRREGWVIINFHKFHSFLIRIA
jgi:hypothetical protein